MSDRYPLCPHCGMKVSEGDAWCGFCSKALAEDPTVCPTCGQRKNLGHGVAEYMRLERRDYE